MPEINLPTAGKQDEILEKVSKSNSLPSILAFQDETNSTNSYSLAPSMDTWNGIPVFYKTNDSTRWTGFNPLSTLSRMQSGSLGSPYWTNNDDYFVIVSMQSGTAFRVDAFKINEDKTTTRVVAQQFSLPSSIYANGIKAAIDSNNVLHIVLVGSSVGGTLYKYVELPDVLTTVTITNVSVQIIGGSTNVNGMTVFHDKELGEFMLGIYYLGSSIYYNWLLEVDMVAKTCILERKQDTPQNGTPFKANNNGTFYLKKLNGNLWLSERNSILDVDTLSVKLDMDDYLKRGLSQWLDTVSFNGKTYMVGYANSKLYINLWEYDSVNNTVNLQPLLSVDIDNGALTLGYSRCYAHRGGVFFTLALRRTNGSNTYNSNIITYNVTDKFLEAEAKIV